MGRNVRRAFAFVAGLSVVALEAFGHGAPVQAGGFTKTASQCRAAGGKPGDKKYQNGYYCYTPQKDAYCSKVTNGRKAMWNVEIKACDNECFLTTACSTAIGLDDDCFELEYLRLFRDSFLVRQPDGKRDIEEYYAKAPDIVGAIMNRIDAASELNRIYALYVLPCAVMARLGFKQATRARYTAMMRDLSARYGDALKG